MKAGNGIVHYLTATEIASDGASISGGIIYEVNGSGIPTGNIYATGAVGVNPEILATEAVVNSTITNSGLPSYYIAASQSAMLALAAKKGDWCNRTDLTTDTRFLLTGTIPSTLGNWTQWTDDFTDAMLTKLNGIAAGATAITVENVLTSNSTVNALSAAQGKALQDTKEPKVTGKGLSANDYTTVEKSKLAGVAAGAEVNVQSDWNAASGDEFIANKPTVPALSSTTPTMNGTAAVGVSTTSAKADHVHPSDTSREVAANKNAANGYAGLDANSRVLPANLPSFATLASSSIAPILGANIGLPGYRRSKIIPINSTTTGTGDYQVEIVVGESAGSVGANFHLGGNSLDFPALQKDSGEFQFVFPDSTIVPFFVVEVTGVTPNRVARIFLRIPGVTGQATAIQKLVFMLYDNNIMAVASQMSPLSSVFNLLADDFDGATVDNGLWLSTGITTTPVASVLTFGGGNTARLLDSIATFSDNTEVLSRFTFTQTAASTSAFGYKGVAQTDDYMVGDVWTTNPSVWVGTFRVDLVTAPDATSRLYRLRRNAGAGVFSWHNGTSQITQNSTSVLANATSIRGWNTYDNSVSIDFIAVRQCLAVPPTLGTVVDV